MACTTQRLVQEFETQARTLQEMEEQVKNYRAAGKLEAAARLQDQMILLQVSAIALETHKFQN